MVDRCNKRALECRNSDKPVSIEGSESSVKVAKPATFHNIIEKNNENKNWLTKTWLRKWSFKFSFP